MTTQDFSDETLEMFNEAKNGTVSVFDFITRLLNADFDKNEVKQFCNKHFGNCSKAVKLAISLL